MSEQDTAPSVAPETKAGPDRSWVRLAGGSSALAAVGLLATSAVAGALIPPVLVFAIVFAAFAVALFRGAGRKTLIGLAVVSALAILMNTPFALGDLSHPESASGFVPSLITVVATFGAFLGSILGAVGRGGAGARWVGIAGAAIVVIAVGASAVATLGLSDDDQQSGDVEVVASDVEYPDQVEVDAGGALFVDNEDPFRHTLLIEGTDVAQELPASTARRIEVEVEPGTYRYYCDVTGHEDMEGELQVR